MIIRKKQMQEMINGLNDTVNALSRRVSDLEQQGVIQTIRPLTKDEISGWRDSTFIYQSPIHTDTFKLKDVVQLLLDYFDIRLVKTPGKTELKAKT